MNLLQIHEPGQTPLPHQDALAVGIDLGTTHSVAAVAHNNPLPLREGAGGGAVQMERPPTQPSPARGEGFIHAEVLHNIHGHALLPSVVYYGEDGSVEVGYPARARYERGEAGAVASVKRRMNDAGQRIRAGGREVTPVEVSAEILKELKKSAERALGKPVTKAVITVPAYFDDAARAATKDAARLAGLEALRLINEPTAAALAYGLDKGAQGIYAIYDLGGGTFDISLLKLEQGVFQVLATGGDTALGGDDFDQAVAAWALAEMGVAEESLDAGEVARLVSQARAAKHGLTEKESVEIPPCSPPASGGTEKKSPPLSPHSSSPPFTGGIKGGNLTLTREIFDALAMPYVARTIEICRRALLDAKLSIGDVKGVVMVGGSTRVPLVIEKVKEFFGKPPLTDVNPDEVVALGAAIQAHGLTQGSDNLLLDVVPLSLGLETMGGLTEKIIERNTPIPVSVSQEFTTYQDGQSGMQVLVVQGEREMAADNRPLAKFELSGIPPLPAGIARVKVTFAVDADGLLTVSAEEKTTGARQAVHVKPSYGLEPEEMERMLRESMEHAREDITQRLLAEARVEAERAVIELESAMKQDAGLLEEAEKKRLERQIQVVRNAAQADDRDYIDAELAELGRAAQDFAQRRMDKAIGLALKGTHIDKVSSH